jgi:hypothetical protein
MTRWFPWGTLLHISPFLKVKNMDQWNTYKHNHLAYNTDITLSVRKRIFFPITGAGLRCMSVWEKIHLELYFTPYTKIIRLNVEG